MSHHLHQPNHLGLLLSDHWVEIQHWDTATLPSMLPSYIKQNGDNPFLLFLVRYAPSISRIPLSQARPVVQAIFELALFTVPTIFSARTFTWGAYEQTIFPTTPLLWRNCLNAVALNAGTLSVTINRWLPNTDKISILTKPQHFLKSLRQSCPHHWSTTQVLTFDQ